ncbi:uncharacterized protein LOC117504435 [Thalassophryne amazonica]|uniref:uncharacterized protein LOC117504435 n=1 Tax=Thalassophryne amazonica TaxID=390379 RepID=UPI001470FF4D|nr:uncharacterized protein LOC117504435 [Thalassophryne amazonica]
MLSPPVELLPVQTSPVSPPQSPSDIHHPAHTSVTGLKSANPAGSLQRDASVRQGQDSSLICDQYPVNLVSSSTSPRSGSGAQVASSPSSSRLEWSQRWPVLPPISPVRGCSDTSASPLSRTRSQMFDELDDVAPQTASCPSVALQSDASGCHLSQPRLGGHQSQRQVVGATIAWVWWWEPSKPRSGGGSHHSLGVVVGAIKANIRRWEPP